MSIQFSAKPLAFAVALIATGGLLSACGGGSTNGPRIQVSPANAYLLTSQNRIIGVDLDDTQYARSVIDILTNTIVDDPADDNDGYSSRALDIGEQILDIDYRNAEGQLYALTRVGNEGRIIRIDGQLILRLGTLSADPSDNSSPYTGLSSSAKYTIDFNPTVDKLRIIGNDGTNLRVTITPGAEADPDITTSPATPTALVTTDGPINCQPAPCTAPIIAGAAYTDEGPKTSARSARLFGLDKLNTYALDANAGTVTTVRGLGVTGISDVNGYDISPANNQGVAIFTVGGTPSVYAIDSMLNGTGSAATKMTSLPALENETYIGLSLVTDANPTVTTPTAP
jgi:hypothetical protein